MEVPAEAISSGLHIIICKLSSRSTGREKKNSLLFYSCSSQILPVISLRANPGYIFIDVQSGRPCHRVFILRVFSSAAVIMINQKRKTKEEEGGGEEEEE